MDHHRPDLWNNINCAKIYVIAVPGEIRQKETVKTFEDIVAYNFQSLMKIFNLLIQEAQQTLSGINKKIYTQIYHKLLKDKEKVLKEAKEN